MDSDLGEYYDMLRKTESATAYIDEILSRKEVQKSGREPVDKKGITQILIIAFISIH